MTNEYELADDERQRLIYTKDMLLAPLLPGMEQPPHPMRLGDPSRTTTSTVRSWSATAQLPRSRPVGSRRGGPVNPDALSGAATHRRADRLLRPGAAGPARRDRDGVRPERRALRAVAGARRCCRIGVHVPDAGRPVPGLRADHRLHRRDHDAVPVRADAHRARVRRLDHRGAPRSAGRRADGRHRARRAARHRPGARAVRDRAASGCRGRSPNAARWAPSPRSCSPPSCSRSS